MIEKGGTSGSMSGGREISVGQVGRDPEKGIIRETTDTSSPLPLFKESPSSKDNPSKKKSDPENHQIFAASGVPKEPSKPKRDDKESGDAQASVEKVLGNSVKKVAEVTESGLKVEAGREKREVLDPKSKPIVAIHASHDEEDTGNLVLMDKAIRSQIAKSHPEKKVAVVLEHNQGPRAFSDRVRALVADEKNPMLPSDALVQAVLEERFPDGVPEAADQERRIIRDSMDPYHQASFTRLDRIAHDHPGKLEVVVEAHDQALIDKGQGSNNYPHVWSTKTL